VGGVYVIKGRMGTRTVYYVGSTYRTVQQRWMEHRAGQRGSYTAKMKDKELAIWFACSNNHARAIEGYLKDHRRVVYHLVGKKRAQKRFVNFLAWLKEHGMEIGEIHGVDNPYTGE
jgi:predicted GIY-YIG superfamily endonuclease